MSAIDVSEVERANLEQLRSIWGRRFGAPPLLRSELLLRQLIMWRVQTEREGGLDAPTIKHLRSDTAPSEALLPPGTIVAREWKGVRHDIEVAEDGFLYDGKRWKSLSEIARAITGTQWSGPRFFGLKADQ